MISQFSIGTSRTINLGNFESLRIEATVTIDVDDPERYDALRTQAQMELRQLLEDTYKAQFTDRKKEKK